MGSENYLAIYIGRDTATAVCLDSQDRSGRVQGCFSVTVGDEEQPAQQALASLISRGCTEREWSFSEVAVALDCAMFMQHNIHSEFTDARQIATTVRFDTEEALATDVTDLAIVFQITSVSGNGSDLAVFTAKRKVLSDIILAFQSHNIDPALIEPDVMSLSRFVSSRLAGGEGGEAGRLFGILSDRSGYLIAPATAGEGVGRKVPKVRTFLVGPKQDRGQVLAREMLVTTAMAGGGSVKHLGVFDSAGSLDCEQLGQKLGVKTSGIDLMAAAGTRAAEATDSVDVVGFAIAFGAGQALLEKTQAVNFRDDFMPYQARKLRLQNTLRYFSVSATILVIAVGLYFQTQLFGVNRYRGQLRRNLARDYSTTMPGQQLPARISAKTKLAGELRRLRAKGNPAEDNSMVARLAMLLNVFNECAARTSLNIDSISIAERSASISGNTSGRSVTLILFDTIRKSGLEITKQVVETKPPRDNFRITVVLKE